MLLEFSHSVQLKHSCQKLLLSLNPVELGCFRWHERNMSFSFSQILLSPQEQYCKKTVDWPAITCSLLVLVMMCSFLCTSTLPMALANKRKEIEGIKGYNSYQSRPGVSPFCHTQREEPQKELKHNSEAMKHGNSNRNGNHSFPNVAFMCSRYDSHYK